MRNQPAIDARRPARSIDRLAYGLEHAYAREYLHDVNTAILRDVRSRSIELPETPKSTLKNPIQAPEDVLNDATDSAEMKRGAIGRAFDKMRKPGTKKRIEPKR